MPNELSHRQCELILNAHRFTGFSDDDPPVDFPAIDLTKIQYGQDGTLYATDTGRQGGEMMVKLAPSSPSAQRIARWFRERQQGARRTFSGTYGDPGLGYSLTLEGGKLVSAPPIVVPGQTYEAKFSFERLIPQMDGAQFDPAPAAA